MSLDTWLGAVGIAVGLLGIALAYIFYRKAVRNKVLAIAYTDPIPLIMTFADIRVSYENTTITELSRVYVLLWNRGTAPIEAGDFIAPIKFSSNDPILRLGIHAKDPAVAAGMDLQTKSLNIELLRPGEAITLIAEVANAAYRPDIQVQMKSSDMSRFIWGMQALYPGAAGLLVASLLIFVEYQLFMKWLGASEYTPPATDPGVFVFLLAMILFLVTAVVIGGFFPILFGALAQKLTATTLTRITSPVAWDFFKLKLSAFTIRSRSKDFRKVVDTAIKKITT